MRNSIGNSVILTLSGESHGEMVCAVLDGLSAGIPVEEAFIAAQLTKRRPSGKTDTARVEPDEFKIVSGVFNGYTTGSPVTILIPNSNVHSSDYEKDKYIVRPGHADFVAHERFAGYEDYRGGGHFSGRITVGIVAAGAIAIQALERKGIRIATHILSCGSVSDKPFSDFNNELDLVNTRSFPVIDDVEAAMSEIICKARSEGDSLGGVIQTAITGLEAGLGEPWFDSLDGSLARAMFSLGGVKAVEFGAGFGISSMKGSEANDCFRMENGKVVTTTNNNGGVNGGLSNGMPVIFNCAVKPTPSISKVQDTVNLQTRENTNISVTGRHDPAIIRRICIVATSLTAIVLCDMLSLRHGQDYLR